jgi:hypothetical protein
MAATVSLLLGSVASAATTPPAATGPSNPAPVTKSSNPAPVTKSSNAAPVTKSSNAAPVISAKAATAKSAKSTAGVPAIRESAPTVQAKADSAMTLKGGQEGTEFRTLTVEGEDRVHVDIERPALNVTLDPEQVPGLDQGTARDVLDRTVPDFLTPMVALSSKERTPYLARPWLRQFASGAVARFRPSVHGIDRWKLMVANSRGETVASYEGHGEPPKEIAWDGRSKSGVAVTPGVTYSYVLEAYDRAGNKRNFVGEGFEVAAYRIDDPTSPRLVMSGKDLATDPSGRNAYLAGAAGNGPIQAAAPPVLLEAASWVNQTLKLRDPVRIRAAARSRDQASALANRAAAVLAPRTLGDPSRLQIVADVEPDAPAEGTLTIGPGR